MPYSYDSWFLVDKSKKKTKSSKGGNRFEFSVNLQNWVVNTLNMSSVIQRNLEEMGES